MKQLFSLFVALVLAASVSACQRNVSRENVTDQRTIGSFHAVKVSTGIELVLKQGNEESVTISADEKEDVDAVKTEVVDGELRIYIDKKDNNWHGNKKRVKAYVAFKKIDGITGQSGSKTTIEGTLNGEGLAISLGSGSSIDGQLAVTALSIKQGEGSSSVLKGQTGELTVSVSSGSSFQGYDLSADNVTATATSGSEIKLQANKSLTANASSGADISYKGGGSLVNTTANSGGKVRKAS